MIRNKWQYTWDGTNYVLDPPVPLGYIGKTPLGAMYQCVYTGHIAIAKWFKFVSPILPQSPVAEAMYPSAEAVQKRKESIRAFNELDANCNTCRYFERKFADNKKGSSGASNFVYGSCKSDSGKYELVPYKREGYQIMVHVADFLGMPCWEGR